ncbi:TIGR04283 family arsenosugar biosynthesis glycosyltransferase [Maridesulfovibrio sp.]|uniref:TIGR04283 family arsenosugar biosynthesis glycosyltransferase n=1 Tax=Maridesulfovibrio sp. TaxID=2795000 RepID=UPI002A186F5D|nr:TIGR04283 family arsenosugar biosynthesis glycosyltransferase [Maridesulfovibrio sp.]
MAYTSKLSVIIPVFNEQERIGRCIENVRQACGCDSEIIVVDGNPEGTTIREISDDTVTTMVSDPGRARQMNAGARAASGGVLLFLHADTLLPAGADRLIEEALGAPAASAGAFKLTFDRDTPVLRFIAFVADLRTRIERVPYGDQAVFIRKDTFEALGGYPDIPLMEDVEFFRRIKKQRREIVILKAEIKTSSRRYNCGPLRCAVRNTVLRILHLCGVSPSRLAKLYR